MHRLIDFICDEMDELERKVEKDGKLSMAEVEYLDMLAHTKKNLLKAEEMTDDGEYSGRYYDGPMMSYARGRGRGAKRDAMGRYSRADETITKLHHLMDDAPDERTRQEIKKLIDKMEMM